MDTTGKILIDDFNGSYCGQGIYLVKGKNAYSAFWRGGKFISPFIYNNYIYRGDSYVAPPPINKVVGNCIVTVVINQGNNAFGLMDINGKAILSPIYHYILPLGDNLFFVSGNNGMFYCDASGIIYADGIMGQ